MAGLLKDVDVVHCHTWYTHLAGCLVKQCLHRGEGFVLTTHSLEPHRPWKVEQLGTAYNASSWVERTAYENADGVVAVSASMREDVHELYGVSRDKIRVIHNGIDLHQYRPMPDPAVLINSGINPDRRFVLFVGRITRQKGDHPPGRGDQVDPIVGVQVVLSSAGAAGHAGDRSETRWLADRVERARLESENPIIWIPEIVPKDEIITLYTHATPFRPVRRCTSRSGSSTLGGDEALRDAGGGLGRGGSSRWSCPARPACSCPLTPKAAPTSSRRTRLRSSPADLADAINKPARRPRPAQGRWGSEVKQKASSTSSVGRASARWTMDFYWDLVQAWTPDPSPSPGPGQGTEAQQGPELVAEQDQGRQRARWDDSTRSRRPSGWSPG